ncbi:hypothetical protein SAMN05421780_106124 [Flexibacter flexilis DSM 6793]|uniref:Uncharacterized protein n=1 Tax=Flexibacter flexilis DSM 6793 TaxID=927664 RepID=A0A1I1JVG1_9BACT|nr:hypothetical protein [Flexibacter flexilis]SFC52564.1 hypothetical protein SAMN05421780_106124 [Flexibacter flexilis DSM 6793]
MSKESQYGYNRYLDYLHLKASEALSLKVEAEEKVRKDENHKKAIEIATKMILAGFSDDTIAN